MNELLNCNVGCIFLTMGLPTLDPVMTSVLDYIHQHALFLGSWGGFAKSLGLILAMCVTSYECWMMMLGRRGIDVMKLFRIVGISLCIVSANAIADAVAAPGEQMGRVMKAQATRSHQRIDALEKHEAKLQSQYLDKLRAHNDSLDRKRRAEAKLSEDSHWWEEVAYAVKNMDNAVEEWAKEAAVIAETKTAETINMLIRYIGEIIYQVVYFGMLLGQAFMMNVLKIFCPVAFALSIVPPWASAWSQWISKYVSLSLWAPLIYMCSIYADMILKYTILQDTTAYTTLLGSASYTWGEIGGLGMQGIGSTYVCRRIIGRSHAYKVRTRACLMDSAGRSQQQYRFGRQWHDHSRRCSRRRYSRWCCRWNHRSDKTYCRRSRQGRRDRICIIRRRWIERRMEWCRIWRPSRIRARYGLQCRYAHERQTV